MIIFFHFHMVLLELTDVGWFALVIFLLFYLTYYFSEKLPFFSAYFKRGLMDEKAQRRWIYLKRTLGFICLGLLPLIMSIQFGNPFLIFGLGLPTHPYLIWWTIIPSILLIGGSIIRSSKRIDLSYYPEVRQSQWSTRQRLMNSLFWMIYLLGYEYGLRGFLFFSMITSYGVFHSIILNSVIYSLIHIFKGPKEAFGAFFLGILFAYITYYTQSIWIVFIIHAMMAIINDEKAIKIVKHHGSGPHQSN